MTCCAATNRWPNWCSVPTCRPNWLARYQATAQEPLAYRLELPNASALPRLLDELAAAGCPVHRLNVGRQNLEQLFMRLTRRSLRD